MKVHPRHWVSLKGYLAVEEAVEKVGDLQYADLFSAFLHPGIVGEETEKAQEVRAAFLAKCAEHGLTAAEMVTCAARILSSNAGMLVRDERREDG